MAERSGSRSGDHELVTDSPGEQDGVELAGKTSLAQYGIKCIKCTSNSCVLVVENMSCCHHRWSGKCRDVPAYDYLSLV